MSSDSGSIKIENDYVIYKSSTYGSWQIPINDIIAVGEYTNDQGLILDDWFLVFFSKDISIWYEASNYSNGVSEFKKEFSKIKGINNMYSDLANSTDYNSFMLWPNKLYGEPLFNFTTVYISWWRRILFCPSKNLGHPQIKIWDIHK